MAQPGPGSRPAQALPERRPLTLPREIPSGRLSERIQHRARRDRTAAVAPTEAPERGRRTVGPLEVFGQAASDEVARRLAAAGMHVRTGTFAEEYDEGKLWLELEGPLDADLVIALPRLHGPAMRGLPDAPDGFVPVDPYGRVRGVDRVWAVGDMTTRPLKQGGLAAQQADVAAADIAASVAGVEVPVRPYEPWLQGMLLTGDDPLQLEYRPRAPSTAEASSRFLGWPAHKVAGRHFGPYLDSLSGAAKA